MYTEEKGSARLSGNPSTFRLNTLSYTLPQTMIRQEHYFPLKVSKTKCAQKSCRNVSKHCLYLSHVKTQNSFILSYLHLLVWTHRVEITLKQAIYKEIYSGSSQFCQSLSRLLSYYRNVQTIIFSQFCSFKLIFSYIVTMV